MGKHLCQGLFFNKVAACNFIVKENLAQVFSCEFCKISKNAFSYRAPLVAASSLHLYCNCKYYHSSSEAYLEPCQISMIEFFEEIVNSQKLFLKILLITLRQLFLSHALEIKIYTKIELLLKISVLKSFANFSGQHLCEGLQLY